MMSRCRNFGRTSSGIFHPVFSCLPALPFLAVFVLALLFLAASPASAQEPSAASVAPAVVAGSNPPVPEPVIAPPSVAPPSVVPAPAPSTNSSAGEIPIMAVPLSSKDPLNHYLTRERAKSLQERLHPSVQNIEARGGAARFIWNQRHEPSSILQLINPLAPTEYGVTSVSYYQVPASVAAGQPPLPRGFRNDRTHEANGLFFRAGW